MQKFTNQLKSLSTNYISKSRCWYYSTFRKVWPDCQNWSCHCYAPSYHSWAKRWANCTDWKHADRIPAIMEHMFKDSEMKGW